jgi:WD40 repeat protein
VAASPRSELLAWSGKRNHGGGAFTEALDAKPDAVRARLPISDNLTVHSLCFSPDGKFLATSVFENRLRVWDTATWQEVFPVSEPELGKNCVTFSVDGRYIAGSDEKARIVLWALPGGQPVRLGTHPYTLQDLDFSPDGQWLVTCDFRGTVKVWSVGQRQEHWSFNAPEHPQTREVGVSGSKFLPDNRTVVTAGIDGCIRFWDIQTRREASEAILGGVGRISMVALSPNKRLLAVASGIPLSPLSPGGMTIWDVVGRKNIYPGRDFKVGVSCCCFTSDGQRLVVGMSGGKGLTLLDLPKETSAGSTP